MPAIRIHFVNLMDKSKCLYQVRNMTVLVHSFLMRFVIWFCHVIMDFPNWFSSKFSIFVILLFVYIFTVRSYFTFKVTMYMFTIVDKLNASLYSLMGMWLVIKGTRPPFHKAFLTYDHRISLRSVYVWFYVPVTCVSQRHRKELLSWSQVTSCVSS